MKLILNNVSYMVTLEDNDTAKALVNLLPLDLTMRELNGNEKYVYLPNHLPSDPKEIATIKRGDLMLYGTNCLVLFYKSFKTTFPYTKIGRVENFKRLSDKSIQIVLQ